MEGLIIFIIISLISMFFKDKEQKPTQKPKRQMPPFGNPSVPEPAKPATQVPEQPARRSLEDFAREIFDQLEQQEKAPEKRAAAPTEPVKPVVVERPAAVSAPVVPPSTRPKMVERPLVQQAKAENEQAFQVVPKTKEAFMQAVVMSEILGAPKSRKRA